MTEAGINGAYVDEEDDTTGETKRKYYRKIPSFDVQDEPNKLQVVFIK